MSKHCDKNLCFKMQATGMTLWVVIIRGGETARGRTPKPVPNEHGKISTKLMKAEI